MALENIKLNKENVAKSYNKKVKGNNLPKMILCGKQFYLLGQKTLGSANSLPNWEGPYIVSQVIYRETHKLVDIERKESSKSINENFLKRYYPSIWETITK